MTPAGGGPVDRPPSPRATTGSAVRVGLGILLSRVSGFFRDLTIAFFLGTGTAAGAYTAALRVPNILRNLLGEGTLSAAFVPVYSALLGSEGRTAPGPRRLARGVLGLVLVAAGLVVALGVILAPLLARLVAPGFDAEASALTSRLVRILFPMAGVMIVGAWCLGVLNSHRRFFLPFVAPVLWNAAQIAGLLIGARAGWTPLVVVLAWSTLIGSFLQVAVQLPSARRVAGSLRPAIERRWEPVRTVRRNAVPVAVGQGIFQISSFLDVVLASLLAGGVATTAVAGMYYAQRIAMLPLALFGVSVATASLPEMSRGGEIGALRPYLARGFIRILFFVLPAAVVLLLFGDLVVSLIYERGEFGADSRVVVTWILGAYAVGIVASSLVKLFASGFHALQDTRTPMRIAAVAVTTGVVVGAAAMLALSALGTGARAAAGLALGGSVGAWLNLTLLWRGLGRRGGALMGRAERRKVLRIAAATAVAAAAAIPARIGLEGAVGETGFATRGVVLAGTLLAGGVPYLLIARRAGFREAASHGTEPPSTPRTE